MVEKIIIAGSGGQGIMLMGKILAEAGMYEDKFVTWLPSYGAEVRGGTAHCMVIISNKEIGSPYIDKADTLIIMNMPSSVKFKSRIKNKGLVILNSSLVNNRNHLYKGADILKYPFTDLALKLGLIKIANMIALGSFLAKRKIIGIEAIFKVMEKIAPESKRNLIAINKQALFKGVELIKDGKS